MRLDAKLPYTSGLPRDVAINTFHFTWDESAPFDSLPTVMTNFYNVAHGMASHGIAWYLSDVINRDINHCTFLVYDAQVPGPPLGTSSFTLGAPGVETSLPLEVAACASYRGSTAGVPTRRQRGRIYAGPLATNSITEPSGEAPLVHPDFVDTLVEASTFLAGNADLAAEGLVWAVYSRTNDAAYPITAGWVDNAFDTQRRRQVDPTARTPWALP